MTQVAAILFAGFFSYAACLSAGLILLKLLRIHLYKMESLFLGFVLGAAILSTTVFALTVAHLAYTGVFLALGLILIAIAMRQRVWPHQAEDKRLSPIWRTAFSIVYTIFAALYIANALLPETSPDALTYHVALIARYFREHHLPAITTTFFASYPEGMEMLFLFGFSIGRHSAAAMVHLLFLLTLPFGMLAYARRFGLAPAGALGGLLFFLSPVAAKDGTVAYNDVGLACVLFACFYTMQLWREQRTDALLGCAGLLAGFAYAVKYNGGLAIVYVLALILFYCRRKFLGPAALAGSAAFLMMAPWIVKNIVVVHNPVMPFADSVFANPYVYPITEQENTFFVRHPVGIPRSALPYEEIVHGNLEGMIGPVFLLAPLALFAIRSAQARQLLFAGIFFLLPGFVDVSTRFLLPALPLISLAMGWAISRWTTPALLVLTFHAVASWPSVTHFYAAESCWCVHTLPWRGVFHRRQTSDYLQQAMSDYEIGTLLDKYVPAGDRILTLSTTQSAYHSRDLIDSWNNSLGTHLAATMKSAYDPDWTASWRHDFRFPEKMVRGIRLVQTEHSSDDVWSLAELRIYRAGTELPRSANWRLKASVNPWEVQSAFDNNLATRWNSGQAYAPGMFIQVDFGGPVTIDQVVVEAPHIPDKMRMRVESIDGQLLAPTAELSDMTPPQRLRRAATLTVENAGIHWLLINDNDGGAGDFRDRTAQWGITLTATGGKYRLYHLE